MVQIEKDRLSKFQGVSVFTIEAGQLTHEEKSVVLELLTDKCRFDVEVAYHL